MTTAEQIMTIAAVILATMLTRFLPFFDLSNTQLHTIPRQSTFLCRIWPAGYLLFERCQPVGRKPCHSGVSCDCGCGGAACMEAPDAAVDCRRNHLLYASGSACILGSLLPSLPHILSALPPAIRGHFCTVPGILSADKWVSKATAQQSVSAISHPQSKSIMQQTTFYPSKIPGRTGIFLFTAYSHNPRQSRGLE